MSTDSQHASVIISENELMFRMPQILSIETVEAVLEDFKRMLVPERATLCLDVAATEQLTTPGVQLIIAIEKTMEASGGALRIVGPGKVFSEIMRFVGYAPKCDMPAEQDGAN